MAKQSRSFWATPNGWAAIALVGAVSYFLIMEHREHVFEYLPFLILLLCPAMHLFMHRGHSHHHDGHHDGVDSKGTKPPSGIANDAYQRGLEEGKRQAQRQASNEGKKDGRAE